jgi:hypothetical protein
MYLLGVKGINIDIMICKRDVKNRDFFKFENDMT